MAHLNQHRVVVALNEMLGRSRFYEEVRREEHRDQEDDRQAGTYDVLWSNHTA
jgi:hypothetical protein